LLPFFKEEIRLYAKNEGVNWREDVSNYKIDYSRNKLRNVFIPQMEAFNFGLKKQILLLIEQFQGAQRALKLKVEPLINQLIEKNILEFKVFDHLHQEEINEFVRLLDMKPTFAKRLVELRNAENGKILKLTTGKFVKIFKEENAFRFRPTKEKKEGIQHLLIDKNVEWPLVFDKFAVYVNPGEMATA
jgi:tRNA(Ile)-lysidine synthase TilS/MesJ